MTVIRGRLLGDMGESWDYIKAFFLLIIPFFFISVIIHIIAFCVWQLTHPGDLDNFYFELVDDRPPIELVLTTILEPETGEAILSEESTLLVDGGLFSPTEDWDSGGLNAGLWGGDANLLPEDAFTQLARLQNGIPPTLVDSSLANAEFEAPAEEGIVNPDPPISLESQAPPYKSYYTAVKRAVNHLWIMPPEAKNQFRPGRLTVLFTIRKDGQLLSLVVQESSGNPSLDHAGLEALRSAAPFAPFPTDFRDKEQLDIIMHFDYRATYRKRESRSVINF